jgi:hypothetical protein
MQVSVSPPSSSARRRAIRYLIAPLAALAPRGSRFVAAYFVVAQGRKACPLPPPQHGGARSGASKVKHVEQPRPSQIGAEMCGHIAAAASSHVLCQHRIVQQQTEPFCQQLMIM